MTQRNALVRMLAENGWRFIAREESDLDWWADEILVIESDWAPNGLRGYLTFLVDPMHDGLREKEEFVWAVSASAERPVDHAAAKTGILLSLGRRWKQRLPEFVRQVNSLRQTGATI